MTSTVKNIVISSVNFTEGGPLTVLKNCLAAFAKNYIQEQLNVTVLVNSVELVKQYKDIFTIIEYPDIKTSWFKRLHFEYITSKHLSADLKADLWIALHDMTPNVKCKQVVYCHNPSPFYKVSFKDAKHDYKFFLFSLFYKYLYAINIKKNKYVIVQQDWLRKEFENRYQVKTIVAYPAIVGPNELASEIETVRPQIKKIQFFYPAFPRVFKNFEVLFEAARLLSAKRDDFEVIATINGSENAYSNFLKIEYHTVGCIKFIGKQSLESVHQLYKRVDFMVFPSKLETWGLPLTEFKTNKKPILAADLRYAREAVGRYNLVKYFDPENPAALADIMESAICANLQFDATENIKPDAPFFVNWDELISFLVNHV